MNNNVPPDLDDIGRELASRRPEPAPGQLSAVRRRVFGATPARRSAPLLAALTIGMGILLTGGGVGMAVSGLSSTRQVPVDVQYPTTTTPTTTTTTSDNTVTATTPSQGDTDEDDAPGDSGTEDNGGGGSAPTLGGPAPEARQVSDDQAMRQLSEDNDKLPFTGYAALPILLFGGALIAGGAVLRRRTRPEGSI